MEPYLFENDDGKKHVPHLQSIEAPSIKGEGSIAQGLLKINMEHKRWRFGRWCSFFNRLFLGSMLIFQWLYFVRFVTRYTWPDRKRKHLQKEKQILHWSNLHKYYESWIYINLYYVPATFVESGPKDWKAILEIGSNRSFGSSSQTRAAQLPAAPG